jgi:hypothetical protein
MGALGILLLVAAGCSVKYSFTGASISPDTKTINIKYFPNHASLVEPTLSQRFTDALRDRFTSQTSLTLVNSGGDLILEGSVTDYSTQPVAIQGNDQAAMNRLSITVQVVFTNTKNDAQSYETSFTRYTDYSSGMNLSEVQETLIGEINEMLVDDIFNKSVVNW